MAWLTETDVQNYGSELIDVTQRAALHAVAPHLQAIEQQNAELRQRLAKESRHRLDQAVEAAIPSYREIDRDPHWHRWLLGTDALSGEIRQRLRASNKRLHLENINLQRIVNQRGVFTKTQFRQMQMLCHPDNSASSRCDRSCFRCSSLMSAAWSNRTSNRLVGSWRTGARHAEEPSRFTSNKVRSRRRKNMRFKL
jgi:hypothetical protein